jgi:galactokinase
LPEPQDQLIETFGSGGEVFTLAAPGRVNLIGEHIDYHGLAVLPMAIGRRIRIAFRRRSDRTIRAFSAKHYGHREFVWEPGLFPIASGDWENYLRAAARAVAGKWGVLNGIDAAVVSDLPAAAGLSSSSALIVAVALGLLRANGYNPEFQDLMEILPEGEQFVGTRGGGMDHAASLASRAGYASWIAFEPVSITHVPVPPDWGFLVAHSLTVAEKSGGAREEYNARRKAGTTALARLGVASYREASPELAGQLTDPRERDSFLHVTTEAQRVTEAVGALRNGDVGRFGSLLMESHESLRHRLHVSTPALDRLVEAAMQSGAAGARLTGAGFGGCAVIFAQRKDLPAVRRGLIERFYRGRAEFDEGQHLIEAEPGPGALSPEKT